eukprot:TRINITY_DN17492_c0_g1_i1.p2 TRINITY_DN17492_c0_g1~~TRINITY_DN17492_c0_g1_i1.p2  ORF type:complete len:154 (-),score=37.43 TRINITY_DN17492_c0_g1_i1:63-524(-)
MNYGGRKYQIPSAILNQQRTLLLEHGSIRMNRIKSKDHLLLLKWILGLQKVFFKPELELTNSDNAKFFQLKELDTIKVFKIQTKTNSKENSEKKNQSESPQNKKEKNILEKIAHIEEKEEEKVQSDDEPQDDIILQQQQFIEQLLESDNEKQS